LKLRFQGVFLETHSWKYLHSVTLRNDLGALLPLLWIWSMKIQQR
jgi:hypothetical protein